MTTNSQTTPGWLVAAVQARIDFMLEVMGGLPEDFPIIITPLTEPPDHFTDEERQRWERSCDNCDTYCPVDDDFFTGSLGHMIGETYVEVTFGSCATCVGHAE